MGDSGEGTYGGGCHRPDMCMHICMSDMPPTCPQQKAIPAHNQRLRLSNPPRSEIRAASYEVQVASFEF